MDKPDILEVIGRYTSLRKVGREYIGLSPCHNDRKPSLRANADKQVWYCDPCGSGGDVIRFIEVAEKVSFKEALHILGIDDGETTRRETPERRAAEKVVAWVNDQAAIMKARLCELDEQIELADEIHDIELAEAFWRERQILADLCADLPRIEYLPDFIELKDSIEMIGGGGL
jgi:DNA primase